MKDLIYHKFHNGSIGGYFVRNGEDVSKPIDEYSASAEIQGWLDGVISSSKAGIVTVRFDESSDDPGKQRTAKEAIDEPCADSLVMIPVHEWIWQRFKEAYPDRTKTKFDTDEGLDKELIKVAHDWICRAIQYYTDQGIEDPWTIMEAYEIAMNCPDIRIRREHGTWTINTAHMFDVEAKNASELLRKVRSSREYIEAAVPQRRTAKEVVDEAMEIAKGVPAMTVKERAIPGYEGSAPYWIISFADNDYTAEARGAAHLLEEVNAAKAIYEELQEIKRIEDEEESEDEVIHLNRIDQSAKRLLIHFIENLTIGEAMCILAESNVYPHIAFSELYGINIQLRESLGKGIAGNE